MEVKLPEAIAKAIGEKEMRKYGVEEKSFAWREYATLNLREFTPKQARHLRDLVAPHIKGIRGATVLLKDLDTWLLAVEKGEVPKARTVEHFASIATEMLARVPGHRVYEKADMHGEAWLCSYVTGINYTPPHKGKYYEPAKTTIQLVWEEFGGRHGETITFVQETCVGLTPYEALANKGYHVETPEMRANYLAEVQRFLKTTPEIGKQYWAKGVASDEMDGNERMEQRERNRGIYSWHKTHSLFMERNGQASQVVVDVFRESAREDREDSSKFDADFWFTGKGYRKTENEDDEEGTWEAEDEDSSTHKREKVPREDVEEAPVIEIPIHPLVAVFDLRKHIRLRIHINYLTEYIYDPTLGKRLVLPKETRDLVEMLLEHKSGFKDIIAGKGTGAVVLCAGPPGTGKTLTAEVYAEVMERPLYSVQCSQLGTDPDALEEELLRVFARAQRWNAILQLDEADVYVHTRGSDLQQNAIVGVFLRVLEYFGGVLFLTTNRSELVDDAIASRCIARLDYKVPTPEDQHKIWVALSQVSGITLPEKVIAEVVKDNPARSGRDVKNLLKLASLVSASRKKPITADSIKFVEQFKPTSE